MNVTFVVFGLVSSVLVGKSVFCDLFCVKLDVEP